MSKRMLQKFLSVLSSAVIVAPTITSAAAQASDNEANQPSSTSSIAAGFHSGNANAPICGYEFTGTGNGVKIALLDAGVTKYDTYKQVSFIDDNTIGSDHGDLMMSILSDKVPDADIMDVRVLDDEGKGTYSDVSKGIRWAVDNDADIIVMSFAGESNSSLLGEAVEYAEKNNVFVVAAAGNSSCEKLFFPAAFETVISVGAIDAEGNIYDFSNFGQYVDTYGENSNGTSGAAQVVAASAAVAMEFENGIKASELRKDFQINPKTFVPISTEENADAVVYATACNHTYTLISSTAATCTTNGSKKYKCTKCSNIKTETITKLGHNWESSWHVTKNATCTATGSEYKACQRYGCGTRTTQTIPALGHNYSWVRTKQPTCTATGTDSYKCSRCSDVSKTSTVAALGHNWESSWHVSKNPTCTATGSEYKACQRYGCGTTTSQSIPALGHNYSWVRTKQPTCTASGTDSYKCSRCSDVSKTSSVAALGHNWESSWHVTKQPTCTAEGSQYKACQRYGCGATTTQSIAKKSHTYSWVTTKQPTCTATGTESYRCTGCGDVSNTRTVAALGHDWESSWHVTKQPTCTAEGSQYKACQRYGCGATTTQSIAKKSHTYSWVTTKQPTCTATGTESYRCTACGDVSNTRTIAALGHNWESSWHVSKQPTCTAKGSQFKACQRYGCTATTTQDIAALGHAYSWVTTKQPTCTATGTDSYKCSRCGDVKETKTTPALGHNWESTWHVTKQPTCTAEGSQYKACQRYGCGATTTQSIAKKSHTYSWVTTKQPTCTATGTESYRCTACGDVSDTRTIAALGHNWESSWHTSKQPTCTANGSKFKACQRYGCTATTTQDIAALGHAYAWVTTKQPTCTATGTDSNKCSRCGDVKETKTIAALGHDWESSWHVSKQPTCTEKGSQFKACQRYGCGATTTQDIAALGHAYKWVVTKQPTCTVAGIESYKCSRCGDVSATRTVAALGHDWESTWHVTKQPTCTEPGTEMRACTRYGCGAVQTREITGSHKYTWVTTVQPTCTNPGKKVYKCSVCGYIAKSETIEALGHDWESWHMTKQPTCTEDGEQIRACQRYGCGTVEKQLIRGDHLSYTWVTTKQPTCTTTGLSEFKCTRCGNVKSTKVIPALGHDFEEWRTIKEATCLEDGTQMRACQRYGCGTVETGVIKGSHKYSWITTIQPTCVNPGKKVYKCTVCGDVKDTEVIPALGHDFEEPITLKAPTCTEKGEQISACKRYGCGTVKSEVIEELGHDFVLTLTKQPTLNDEGLYEDVCSRCGEKSGIPKSTPAVQFKPGISSAYPLIFDSNGNAYDNGTYPVFKYASAGMVVVELTFFTNYDWVIVPPGYAHVVNKATNKETVSGSAGTNTLYIWLTKNSDQERSSKITFKIQGATITYNIKQQAAPVTTTTPTTTKTPSTTTQATTTTTVNNATSTTTEATSTITNDTTTTTKATSTTTKITSTTTKITTTTTESSSTTTTTTTTETTSTTTTTKATVQKIKLGDSITATMYDDGSVYIAGEGDMYDNDTCPFDNPEDIKNVIMQDFDAEHDKSITSIGANLFNGAENLEEIVLPEKIRKIGKSAFADAKNLKDITITDAIEMIGDNAFNGCTGLETATYTGTEKQWDSVFIGENNEALTDKIKFNGEITNPVEVSVIGDANGDGVISKADGILLSRFIAGWDNVNIVVVCGDINGDGIVSKADGMILARYLAGWEGYEKYFE